MCDQTTPMASAATRCCTTVLAIAIAVTLWTRSTAARSDPMRTWTITVNVVMHDARHAISRLSHPFAVGRMRGWTSVRAATPVEHGIAERFRGALGPHRSETPGPPDG